MSTIDKYDPFGTLAPPQTEEEAALAAQASASAYIETLRSVCAAFKIPPSYFRIEASSEVDGDCSEDDDAELVGALNMVCPHIRSALPSVLSNPRADCLDGAFRDVLRTCVGQCEECGGGSEGDGSSAPGDPIHGHCVGCLALDNRPGTLCPSHAHSHCTSSIAAARFVQGMLDAQEGEDDGADDDANEEDADECIEYSDEKATELAKHSVVVFSHSGASSHVGGSAGSVAFCYHCDAFAPLTTFDVDSGLSALSVGEVMNRILLASHCAKAMTKAAPIALQRYNSKGIFLFRPALFTDDGLNDELENDINETATDVVLPALDDALLLLYEGRSTGQIELCISPRQQRRGAHVDPARDICANGGVAGLKGYLLLFADERIVDEKRRFLEEHGMKLVKRRVYLTNERLWCDAWVACHATAPDPFATAVDSVKTSDDEIEVLEPVDFEDLPPDDDARNLEEDSTSLKVPGLTQRAAFNAALASAAAGCHNSDASKMMAFISSMTSVAHFISVAPQLASASSSSSTSPGACEE